MTLILPNPVVSSPSGVIWPLMSSLLTLIWLSFFFFWNIFSSWILRHYALLILPPPLCTKQWTSPGMHSVSIHILSVENVSYWVPGFKHFIIPRSINLCFYFDLSTGHQNYGPNCLLNTFTLMSHKYLKLNKFIVKLLIFYLDSSYFF